MKAKNFVPAKIKKYKEGKSCILLKIISYYSIIERVG